MSELLERLRALRGRAEPTARAGARPPNDRISPSVDSIADLFGAELVSDGGQVHLVRRRHWPAGARHGDVALGDGGIHPLLMRWASMGSRQEGRPPEGDGSVPAGPVVYLDTETTGLAGGTGTYAFVVGVGRHLDDGFLVEQWFLTGPEHEAGYLRALHDRLVGAAAVVSYNGASFDLPLLRTRFALHEIGDPLANLPHLDLLPIARRLWRSRLVDCTLATVERRILGAVRSERDVPGSEVPLRYLEFLRSRDARPLLGVLEHNRADIAALAALQHRVEALLDPHGGMADPAEAHALGRWSDALGEPEMALQHYRAAEERLPEAAWEAARLYRRSRRLAEAVRRWERLAAEEDPRGWIELAKHREHRLGDLVGALEAVAAARACGGDAVDDLARRERRLLERLERVSP